MNETPPTREARAGGGSRLYTLSEIAAETGISLDDLARYRKRLGDRLPSVERGDRRRYPEAAIDLFRSYHRRGNGHGPARDERDGDVGRRPLLSLAAQRRRREEEQRRERQKRAAEPVVDPGPPDPMLAALEALSGVGEEVPEREAPAEPRPRDEEQRAEERRDEQQRDEPPTEPPTESEPRRQEESHRRDAPQCRTAPRPEAEAEPREASRKETATAQRTSTPRRQERRSPARPSRPVYTLQEVHEITGIPYAKLALYAASHADQIPSVGERRSPAYMRQGMEAFCRLHALKEPGWEMPDLGPEKGWDDAQGLAARLQVLEGAQATLAEQLRLAVRTLRRTWDGEAVWES